MMRLSIHSEEYGSTGNIGENFQRLLGTPALNPLQTVIRESVQNIADATVPGTSPEILIRLRQLTRDQRRVLATRIMHELPSEHESKKLLETMVSQRALTVMEVCDFWTKGLGGPTRADRIPVGEKHTDFIDFLRNIGTARDTEQGGGTYGFGKVALYRASKCSTIVVDTLPHGCPPDRRRLIGCHVGRSFDKPEKGMRCRHTGRHWWGVPDSEDGLVDPATGAAARELATLLGFPDRSNGRSGTSIMILDFKTESEDLESIGRRVVEGLLWNFWPRMMIDTPGDQKFKCCVEVNGAELPIPCPEEFPPLDLFSKAMRAARSGKGYDVRKIASQRPAKVLGTLAIERGLRAQRRLLVGDGSLFPPTASHIALMRPVALVVKYLEGLPLADERLEWAGVFIASDEDEVEQAFADAEPPAHDDWNPANFPRGNAKRYVNIALRELGAIASGMDSSTAGQPANLDMGPPLARVAGHLGLALEGVGGDGAGRTRGKRRGRRPRPALATATQPLFKRLEYTEQGPIAVFATEVRQDTRRSGLSLKANAAVAMEGSSAKKLDNNFRRPVVLSIQSQDKKVSSSCDNLQLAGDEGVFEIRVLITEDCAVTATANVRSGEAL